MQNRNWVSTENSMTRASIRNPVTDVLLTPKNAALIVMDYQPVQVNSIASMDRQKLIKNIVGLVKIAKTYDLPIIHSTINVKTGANKPAISQLRKLLENVATYDRTTMNAWEDVEFLKAVKATGRNKLIMTALWTEAGLTFPALDALREGHEVFVVIDAVGGTSTEAHEAALHRIQQAGGRMTSWAQVLCELQRDWARLETLYEFVDLFTQLGGTTSGPLIPEYDVPEVGVAKQPRRRLPRAA
jgi:nicotinamidase-related amidase